MRVRLLFDYRCWRRGEVLDLSPTTGRAWLAAHIAELVAP